MLYTTLELLRKFSACRGGLATLTSSLPKTQKEDKLISLSHILKSNGLEHALWALRATTTDSRKIAIQLAVEFATQALPIFEKEYPEDKRPHLALQAVSAFLDGKITLKELRAASDAASAASYAAHAASDAPHAASYVAPHAARAASYAASVASYVARAASDAARYAASGTARAASDAASVASDTARAASDAVRYAASYASYVARAASAASAASDAPHAARAAQGKIFLKFLKKVK